MSIVLATKPNIPFISPPLKNELKLRCGQIIRILGMITRYGKSLSVNLQFGNQTSAVDDIPLHIDFRPLNGNCIVRNTYQNNKWGIEERDGGCPIKPGDFIEILIEIGPNRFRIALNGTHFCEYEYRLPLHFANFIRISDDADISTVSLEKLGKSQLKYPIREPVYNYVPLIKPLGRDGLYKGRQILIYGKTTFNAERISINFQNTDSASPETSNTTLIALHLSLRFSPNINNSGVIVINSFKGNWLNEERIHNFPFSRNSHYWIQIKVNENHFEIEFNKQQVYNFKFRVPLYECKYCYILGDTSANVSLNYNGRKS